MSEKKILERYEIVVKITNHQLSCEVHIREIVEANWEPGEWQYTGIKRRIIYVAKDNMCPDETPRELARKITEEVWEANDGVFCDVEVSTLHLDSRPYVDHRPRGTKEYTVWKDKVNSRLQEFLAHVEGVRQGMLGDGWEIHEPFDYDGNDVQTYDLINEELDIMLVAQRPYGDEARYYVLFGRVGDTWEHPAWRNELTRTADQMYSDPNHAVSESIRKAEILALDVSNLVQRARMGLGLRKED